MYGHDVFVTLENGWRVMNGQRPHLDFMSSWGVLWSLISALGLTISGHSVDGIGYGNAVGGAGGRQVAFFPRPRPDGGYSPHLTEFLSCGLGGGALPGGHISLPLQPRDGL